MKASKASLSLPRSLSLSAPLSLSHTQNDHFPVTVVIVEVRLLEVSFSLLLSLR